MQAFIKFLLDFGPLAGFFIGYRLHGLMAGTVVLIVLTLVSLLVTYIKDRKVAMAPLISGIAITALGSLTLALQDDLFIKIKPTLVNLVFAAILLGGLYFKKSLLRPVLDAAFHLTDEGWYILTRRWGIFFIGLAILNEIIWRNFPVDFWVNFKVFGMLTITMLFTICQMPLIKRTMVDAPAGDA
jgi:intracellular septation protein